MTNGSSYYGGLHKTETSQFVRRFVCVKTIQAFYIPTWH